MEKAGFERKEWMAIWSSLGDGCGLAGIGTTWRSVLLSSSQVCVTLSRLVLLFLLSGVGVSTPRHISLRQSPDHLVNKTAQHQKI